MNDCVFCRIAKKQIPAEILLENEKLIVFQDKNPVAPVHVLLIPKQHVSSIVDPLLTEDKQLAAEIFAAIQEITEKTGVNENGFRVVVNRGTHGGESVPHLHFHIIGGRELSWPPG
mgnify:CR=1 FL=1